MADPNKLEPRATLSGASIELQSLTATWDHVMVRKRDRALHNSDHTLTLIFLGLLAFAILAGIVGMIGHPAVAP